MKRYWLYLYPYTFLWVKQEEGCIYNAKNYAKIYFENKGELVRLTEILLDINQLYRAELTEELLQQPEVKEWVDKIIHSQSGSLVPDDGLNKPPVSLKPELKLQDGVEYYKWEHHQGIDGNVIHNLHQLIFHINGSEEGNFEYAKQTIYPVQITQTLGHEQILTFIRNARSSAYLSEIVLVGDIVNYLGFQTLLSAILEIGFKGMSVYCLESDFLKYVESVPDWENDKVSYSILVSNYNKTGELLAVSGILSTSCIFLVRSEEEYEQAVSCIEKNNLKNREILPIYTKKNKAFFEDNLYMDAESLAEIELCKREVFIRQTLNIFSFGKLIVLPDGSVYANLNDSVIGNIKEPPHRLIYRELTQGKSWLRVRNQKPCCDCVYQWLCPSPSNYELIIGKPNLCFPKGRKNLCNILSFK